MDIHEDHKPLLADMHDDGVHFNPVILAKVEHLRKLWSASNEEA